MYSSNLESIQPDLTTTPLLGDSVRSSLLVAATGLGKTVMMAEIVRHWPLGRCLMMSHRFELNTQAIDKFEKITGEPVDLEQADYHADQCGMLSRCRTVVASVQSLNSKRKGKYRFEKFDPNEFGLLLIDEAHRSAAASYRRVIDYFFKNVDCYLIGVTATPDRLDGVGLGHIFGTVGCDYNIRWAIDNGWLVPFKQDTIVVHGLDFSSIRSKKNNMGESDLDPKQLAKIAEQEQVLHEMAVPIIDLCEGSTVVFTVSVAQAHRLAEIINRHREYSAVAIDGSLPPTHPKRKRLVKEFKEGQFQFLINCGTFTEGFDAPNVRNIVVARPTKSRALYCQMVGRGSRTLDGTLDGLATVEERYDAIKRSPKPYCRVLDFVGQAGRHKLVCTGDILAGDEPDAVIEEAKQRLQNGEFDGDAIAALEAAKKEAEDREAARRAQIVANVDYSIQKVDIWSPLNMAPSRDIPKFHGEKPMTQKQREYLAKAGLSKNEIEQLNHAQASSLIGKLIERRQKGLATVKQKRLLSKHGYNTDRLTFEQASKMIELIANNGWKRLPGEIKDYV